MSYANRSCDMTNNGISKLNLIELYASNNSEMTDIYHMSNLKILYAFGNYGDINNNDMLNLKIVYTFWNHCGIINNGIFKLNLVRLGTFSNSKIRRPYKNNTCTEII